MGCSFLTSGLHHQVWGTLFYNNRYLGHTLKYLGVKENNSEVYSQTVPKRNNMYIRREKEDNDKENVAKYSYLIKLSEDYTEFFNPPSPAYKQC